MNEHISNNTFKESVQGKAMTTQQEYWTSERIGHLRKLLPEMATEAQVFSFVEDCKRTGLDPFFKQIYLVPRRNGAEMRMITIVGIDGLRLIADRTGRYAPGKETVWTYDNNGNLLSATAYIKKMTKDGTWHDMSATVFYDEFKGSGVFWTQKARLMLGKCAESQCIRKGFPQELSGIYTEEEMDQSSEQSNQTDVAQEKASVEPPKPVTISESEITKLDDLIGENEKFRVGLMNWLRRDQKINSLKEIPVSLYPKILTWAMNEHTKKQAKAEEKIA